MSERVHLGPAPGDGEHRAFRTGGRYLLVTRRGGALQCIDDWCNHAGCLLSEGRVESEVVICPCHDNRVRLSDGALLTRPRLCEDQDVLVVEEDAGQVYWKRDEQP